MPRVGLTRDTLVSAAADEHQLLSLLCASLEGLSKAEIHLGLRRSRGLGEISASHWQARRFDLSNSDGWLAWIHSDHESPVSQAQVLLGPGADGEAAAGPELLGSYTTTWPGTAAGWSSRTMPPR
jgi:hypothetical protein